MSFRLSRDLFRILGILNVKVLKFEIIKENRHKFEVEGLIAVSSIHS